MKRLLLTLLALTSFLSSAVLARDEKTALEEFKKDITTLNTWHDEREKEFKGPLDAVNALGEMSTKLKAINTDGLPADVKDPWIGLLAGLDKVLALTAELPKDAEALTKKFQDPAFMQAFGTKMEAIEKEVKPHAEKLQAAGKKYGIEGIEKIGPK